MDPNESLIEATISMKLTALKLQAVIDVLAREGILTHDEVESRVKELIKPEE